MTTSWCARAWLPPGRVADGVAVEVSGSRIAAVTEGLAAPPAGAERLEGLVLPGFANAHSHAFHRALRGRAAGRTFWSWRDEMYAVAARLDPDRLRVLAEAVYAEMVLAGITAVGEFAYVHHDRDGTPYAEPNAMGLALVEAARAAGLQIAVLDACYLAGGFGQPVEGVQQRFSDGDADRWAVRVDGLAAACAGAADVVVGAAVHSVRAVPAEQIRIVAGWAQARGAPLHVHVSEQRAEVEACLAACGTTPAGLLEAAGALGERTTAVHAVSVDDADVRRLGASGSGVCACPTTEADLADGIAPFRRLADAGCRLSLGTDSHASVDALAEARALEHGQRLTTGRRGCFDQAALLRAATEDGHAALGFPDAGRIAAGCRADLVALRLDSPRTAGVPLDGVVLAASTSDVTDVVAAGRRVVRDGRLASGRDVGALLADATERVVG